MGNTGSASDRLRSQVAQKAATNGTGAAGVRPQVEPRNLEADILGDLAAAQPFEPPRSEEAQSEEPLSPEVEGKAKKSRTPRQQGRGARKPRKGASGEEIITTSLSLERDKLLKIKLFCTQHGINYSTLIEAAHEVLNSQRHHSVQKEVIALAQLLSYERRHGSDGAN